MSKNPRFEIIYNKTAQPVYKFISKRVGRNEAAIEEVFSNTISAAWKGFKTFKHKSSYFTWICRIALNKIADYYRGQVNERSRFVAPLLEDIANIDSGGLTPDEEFSLQELRLAIRKCLNALPQEKRNLLYLRYWGDLTVKEIAKKLHVPERVVEGKVYRAKKLLRKIFEANEVAALKNYTRG